MKLVTKGSGNVFRDLGLPDADILQAKADLVHEIAVILEKRGLNQVEAAEMLGITQPKVSALLNGHLEGFSLERIARFLNALGRDIKISVRPKSGSRPSIHVAQNVRHQPTSASGAARRGLMGSAFRTDRGE